MSEDTLQRVVPVKNYIILGILFVIVVVLVIYKEFYISSDLLEASIILGTVFNVFLPYSGL